MKIVVYWYTFISKSAAESSDSMISGDMTDLNTEAMTTVEFEDVELEDVNLDEDSWDDSVLDEILLISQHASKKFFHKVVCTNFL